MTAQIISPVEQATILRDQLVELGVPQTQAQAIEQIRVIEEIKAIGAAIQARNAMVFEALRLNEEALDGVPKGRRGKGVAAEIGLARRESTARGHRALNTARALLTDLPNTYAALQSGRIRESTAEAVAAETSWLSAEHRRAVDVLIADRFDAGLGPRQLRQEVAAHAQRIDQQGAVERNEIAVTQRRVSVRPAADGMAYLTALLPTKEAIGVYATLTRDATTMVGTGETADPADPNQAPRSKDQVMADMLVERVTGQNTATAVPAEIQVVMTDAALFGDDETPAWLTGHGPMPVKVAKHWLADPDATVFIRRMFTRPKDNQLVGAESRARQFPGGLRRMITVRDDRCRTPYCDAPIKDIDHVVPVRKGGATSWENGSGLCAACNQTKENRGWTHALVQGRLTVTTPTGHQYVTAARPVVPGQPPPQTQPNTPPQIRPDTCGYTAKRAGPPAVVLRLVPSEEESEAA